MLLVRVAGGDPAALATLYRRYGGRLFGYLQRYAGDRMVAEEILQDTLLAVWRSAPRYAGRSGVRTWLFGIARRQAHNRLRVQEPRTLPLDGLAGWADPGPGPAEWAIANAQAAAVADAFAALAPAAPRGAGAGVRGPGAAWGDRGGPGRTGGDGEEPAAPCPRGAGALAGRARGCRGDAMTGDGKRHPTDALAEYAAGVLDAPARTAVEAHLIACPSCRTALLGWTAVAAATVAPVAAPPSSASVVGAVLTRAALAPQAPPVRKRGVGFAGQLLRAELRLVRPSVWVASMLVMACAVAAAAVAGHGAGATALSLVAPLVAVAGVAGVYGPQRDPAFEALAITPTSPRLVLLARVTLVFGYDLALAVAASAVVQLVASEVGLAELVVAWLGPMTLLSALSLVLAMWIGPNVSLGVAAALWALRLATLGVPELSDGWLAARMREVWVTSPGTVAVTLALLVAAVALSRRPGRPRSGWSRPVAW